jgi:hypothetical protein
VSARVDQLVFGYRDGHQLLAASTEIGPRLEAELLPHADARFEGESEHYLVGTWIEELERFMVARVWPAPEMPRPGAVWTHALLLDRQALREVDLPALVTHLRRPSLSDLGSYDSPLEIDRGRPVLVDVPEQLMSALCLVGYASPERNAVVIWNGTEDSEQALLALWRRLPAALRPQFSFRTRGRARTGRSPYLVQIASELAGRSASEEVALIDPRFQAEVPWASALGRASLNPADALAAALDHVAVGRADSVALAQAWPLIEREDAPTVLAWMQANDRPPVLGGLTTALFGAPEPTYRIWRLPESERIATLLRSDQLNATNKLLSVDRLEGAWSSEHKAMLALLDHRATLASASEHLLVRSALRSLTDRELVGRADDAEVLRGILADRPHLLRRPALWRTVDSAKSDALIRDVLVAARGELAKPLVEAEAWSTLARAIDLGEAPGPVADLLARRDPEDLALWSYLMEDSDQELAEYLAKEKGARPEALVLAAATLPRRRLPEISLRRWGAAGRMAHIREDHVAQQAAARLLALALGESGENARKLLIDCFGPTSRALEAGTLEPKTRLELEAQLPRSRSKARSAAEHLNQALIESMERTDWSQEDLARTLEAAGPEARRILKLVGKKSSVRRLVESSLKDLKSLRG